MSRRHPSQDADLEQAANLRDQKKTVRDEKIRAMRRRGVTVKEIADELTVSEITVRKALSTEGAS